MKPFKCKQCPRIIDMTRVHTSADDDTWCSGYCSTEFGVFCSGPCAEAYEKEHPPTPEQVEASRRASNCVDYGWCVGQVFCFPERKSLPRFASCEAECPLRPKPRCGKPVHDLYRKVHDESAETDTGFLCALPRGHEGECDTDGT